MQLHQRSKDALSHKKALIHARCSLLETGWKIAIKTTLNADGPEIFILLI